MVETDVIAHLIDVEAQAANMLMDAQTEADARVAAAKLKADESYKKAYEVIVAEQEAFYAAEKQRITDAYNADFTSYKDEIQAIPKDSSAFNVLLEKLLFGN